MQKRREDGPEEVAPDLPRFDTGDVLRQRNSEIVKIE